MHRLKANIGKFMTHQCWQGFIYCAQKKLYFLTTSNKTVVLSTCLRNLCPIPRLRWAPSTRPGKSATLTYTGNPTKKILLKPETKTDAKETHKNSDLLENGLKTPSSLSMGEQSWLRGKKNKKKDVNFGYWFIMDYSLNLPQKMDCRKNRKINLEQFTTPHFYGNILNLPTCDHMSLLVM